MAPGGIRLGEVPHNDGTDFSSPAQESTAEVTSSGREMSASMEGPSPSVLHAVWGASFYGGFGVLGVTRQLWVLSSVFDVFTDLLGLETVRHLLLREEAQNIMQLMGLPFLSLGVYYIRHRRDSAFLLTSVYGRLLAGGCGLLFTIIIMDKLPSGCGLVWLCDVIPSVLCYLDLLRCRVDDRTKVAMSPLHGIWGAAFYGSIGVLSISHQLWLLPAAARRIMATVGVHLHKEDALAVIQERWGQHVMRLSGLPLVALGLYFLRHRRDPEFLLSTVYGRAASCVAGALLELADLSLPGLSARPGGSAWLLCAGELLPSALCYRAVRVQLYDRLAIDDPSRASGTSEVPKD